MVYLNKVSVSTGVFGEVLVGLDSNGGLRVSTDGDEVRDTLLRVDQTLSDDEQQDLYRPQSHLVDEGQAYIERPEGGGAVPVALCQEMTPE